MVKTTGTCALPGWLAGGNPGQSSDRVCTGTMKSVCGEKVRKQNLCKWCSLKRGKKID